jgi:LysM domain
MTAVTVHSIDQLTARLPRQRAGRVERSSQLTLVPVLPSSAMREHGQLRMTRRGKLVIVLALVVLGICLTLAGAGLFGGSAAAGTTPTHPASRVVVVQPGQTLWEIAGQVAPGTDRRDTIARIVDLNALSGSVVSPGQRIAVPAR